MENRNVSVSVIVPVYNADRYLRECVDSLIGQTLREMEIILVDDGSTDGSGQICAEYAAAFENIKTVRLGKAGGALAARKAGVLVSNGRHIGFVDADDWVEPCMYEELLSCVEEQGADMVICSWTEEFPGASKDKSHGIAPGHYDKRRLETEVYPRMIVGDDFFEWGIFPVLWDALFERELLLRHLLPIDESIRIASDMVCVYPCLLETESLCLLEAPFYHYRQIQGSITSGRMDGTVERESFFALRNYLDQCLSAYISRYNLRLQIRKYYLFVMIPRMDALYTGLDEMEYLFPFSSVAKGEKVVLYGAGKYGMKLYSWLLESRFCAPVLLVDSNYKNLQTAGYPVASPGEIDGSDFDHIIVTILFAKARRSVYQEMAAKYGEKRVAMIDEGWMMSDEAISGFGIA